MSIEILYINITINIVFFILGFICCKLMFSSYSLQNKPNNITIAKHTMQPSDIVSIDETKYVSQIDTNAYEKKYDNLGNKTQTEDNISSSVNKLKNLKK